nr:hypothetical protein [candidate division KSB1 bacterium]
MIRIKLKALFVLISVLASVSSLLAQEIRVEDIQFKNNEEISSGKLQNAMQTKANPWYRLFMPWKDSHTFDEDVFLTDLLRIEKLYKQEGYLDAVVQDYKLNFNQEGDEVNIVIYIEEGEPTKVNRVEFIGSDHVALPIPPDKLQGMVKLKQGKRYREEDLREDYHEIVEKHNNQGYPYIEAKVKPIMDRGAHLVDLEWYLNPGPYCLFGEIEITGNKSVSDKVILRGLGFKEGEPFVRKKLASAQSQVYRLELFQFVSLQAMNLDEKPTNIPIEVRVRETTLRTLKFGLGYGSEEEFRTFGRWRHRNFLGGGRILQVLGKHSTDILPLQLEVEMSQPYFFGNRNDLNVKPFF